MTRRNKIETSDHYNEIVELLVAGYSGRYVSDYLDNEYDEKISYVSLNKYKKEKLNVKAAVRQKILEKEKEKQEKLKQQEEEQQQEKIKPAIEKEADKEIQAQETFEVATDYRYRDIQKLDALIEAAESVNMDLNNIPYDDDKYDPYKEQNLKLKLKKLGLDAIKLKYELIDEDELNVNIQDEKIIGLAESIEKSRQKYFQETEEQ